MRWWTWRRSYHPKVSMSTMGLRIIMNSCRLINDPNVYEQDLCICISCQYCVLQLYETLKHDWLNNPLCHSATVWMNAMLIWILITCWVHLKFEWLTTYRTRVCIMLQISYSHRLILNDSLLAPTPSTHRLISVKLLAVGTVHDGAAYTHCIQNPHSTL